eukprot:TRINITY_DN7024_c0_g1_i2.p1 TRINITY_DN7024_c0_g1~~TRINITY_DN7024_c0_g1_i2.p1  ORF type:complete len:493 (-),score=186.84 TRINITY_DN7024_c0_g1_i2:61-1539(-)
MVFLPSSDKDLIIRTLADAGACGKCCQRFVGEKGSMLYLGIHQEEKVEMEGNKRAKPNACVVCLGALQDCYMIPKLDQVVASIINSGYDAEKFSLSLSLPICLSLRQHSLLVHLAARLPASCMAGMEPEDIVPIKQVWKYIYPDLVAREVSLEHQTGDVTDFFAELQLEWPNESKELSCMITLCKEEYATRAKNINVYNMGIFSRQGVEKSLTGVTSAQFVENYPVPPEVPSESFQLSMKMFRSSVYIGGRYCKYDRELPQTPWFINGVRMRETSIEEIISERMNDRVKAAEMKFLASGREDVDVRMLGSGRPFAFECVNPRKTRFTQEELLELEEHINSHHKGVVVNSLQVVTKEDIKKLKEGEEEKRKRYTALCVTAEPCPNNMFCKLEKMTDLTLHQETPIRVLHRRSNAIREKVVHNMKVEREGLKDKMFKLLMSTSAGTYVKEFVHGDFSRTVPNVGTLLGCRADILALDVEDVELAWPPGGKVASA